MWTRITSIERSTEPTIVYNLEVEGNHNYFVGEIGVLSHNCDIWNAIKATQPLYEGSVIPKSFEIATSGGNFWVHANATKHFIEYAAMKAVNGTPEAVRLVQQAQLSSFGAAVESAAQQGIKYGEKVTVGGWELIFQAPREKGLLPVVTHALYLGN